jgi:hypothetical protein
VGRVPLTEVMWGAAFGTVTGVLYDAAEGLTLVAASTAAPDASSTAA